jgi:hypothetical protein
LSGSGVGTTAESSWVRVLLAAGAVSGPVFVVVVLIQMLTRAGFDPKENQLSLLALGPSGWVQVINFIGSGLLALAGAIGLRQVLRGGRAGTWGPILFGAYGAALVWAGVFRTDPAFGFPPGTPNGPPDRLSWHATLHILGPAVAGLALVAACVVFALRFAAAGKRWWVVASIASAAVYLVVVATAVPANDNRWLLFGGAVIWFWAAAVDLRVLIRGAAA